MKRLTVHLRDGGQHVLDFETDDAGAAALQEVNDALAARGSWNSPATIAGRLVLLPADIRSAELSNATQHASHGFS
jgi:hypothetical protein